MRSIQGGDKDDRVRGPVRSRGIAGTQVWPHDEVTSDGARSGQVGELQLVELVGH